MIRKQLPKGWEEAELGEILTLEYGKSLPKAIRSGSGYPVMGSNGKVDKHDSYLLEGPGIVVGRKGSHGEVVWVEENFYPIDTTYFVKPTKAIDLRFAYYLLSHVDLKSLNRSTAIPGLNRNDAYKLKFYLPPLSEQKRIVVKLDALFGHLETLNTKLDRIPKLLKNFRQQVLTQAVTGELTKEWREGKGFGEWEPMMLGDLGKWLGGGTPSKSVESNWNDGNVLWITPKDMKCLLVSDSIDKITIEAVENSSTKLIPKDSILIVIRSGILRRVLPISSNTKEATVNQDLKVLIPNTGLFSKFLLYSLIALEEDIRANCMKSGTTVESIEFPFLKKYQIRMPKLEEQIEIVDKVEVLFQLASKIENHYKSIKEKIDQLPQVILNKAFKGKLVTQDPNDEPAGMLLERIKADKGGNKMKNALNGVLLED